MSTPGERKLRDSLNARSDTMADAQLDLGAVHEQARSLRRRRRIGTGVAAAAVVAVIAVPLSLGVGNFSGDKGAPAPADSPSATPSQKPSPTSIETSAPAGDLANNAEAARQALEAIALGSDPAIDYLFKGLFHSADGSVTQLPETDTGTLAVAWFHGGPLLATEGAEPDEAEATITQFDLKGNEISSVPGTGIFAVSLDGERLAWWQSDGPRTGAITIVSGMGGDTDEGSGFSTGEATYGKPIGFIDTGELVYQVATAGGPAVMITDSGASRAVGPLLTAGGVDGVNGRISGQLAADDGGTGAVIDAQSNDLIWSKSGWRLGQFSPDEKYVLGFPDGPGSAQIVILDASSGDEVTRVDLMADHGLGYDEVVWESESAVLVEGHVFAGTDAEPHPGTLLRITLDGNLERASAVESGEEGWVFGPRP